MILVQGSSSSIWDIYQHLMVDFLVIPGEDRRRRLVFQSRLSVELPSAPEDDHASRWRRIWDIRWRILFGIVSLWKLMKGFWCYWIATYLHGPCRCLDKTTWGRRFENAQLGISGLYMEPLYCWLLQGCRIDKYRLHEVCLGFLKDSFGVAVYVWDQI